MRRVHEQQIGHVQSPADLHSWIQNLDERIDSHATDATAADVEGSYTKFDKPKYGPYGNSMLPMAHATKCQCPCARRNIVAMSAVWLLGCTYVVICYSSINLSHAYVDTKDAETNPTESEVIGTLASDEALMLEDNSEPSALDIALAKVSGHNLQLHLSVM